MAIQTPSAETTAKLTPNDATILSALFDPESLSSSVSAATNTARIDSSLPSLPQIPDSELADLEIKQKEMIARLSANESQIEEVLSIKKELDEAISRHSNYPSAYLNRAQVNRISLESRPGGSDAIFSSENLAQNGGRVDELFTDLSAAIKVSSPKSQNDPVSPFQARILRSAHSHRAYLYLKASETLFPSPFSSDTDSTSGEVALLNALEGLSKTDMEDLASKDFSKAAWYGDEVAREMSVRTNPYARMCGAIVRNAIREERKEAGWEGY